MVFDKHTKPRVFSVSSFTIARKIDFSCLRTFTRRSIGGVRAVAESAKGATFTSYALFSASSRFDEAESFMPACWAVNKLTCDACEMQKANLSQSQVGGALMTDFLRYSMGCLEFWHFTPRGHPLDRKRFDHEAFMMKSFRPVKIT